MYVERLRGTRGLGVALLLKPCLLVLPDLTDDLLVEVLHDMEAVVDDVREPLKKGALEVGVHVAGDGLYMQTSTPRPRGRRRHGGPSFPSNGQATAHVPS